MSVKKIILTCVVSLTAIGVTVSADVYGVEGGGSDTSGTSANCSNNALTSLCGNPAGSGGGGASWKIFKADDGWGLDDYTGYGGSILKDQYKGEAMEACKSAGWFASFGWDGMKGSNYGYSDYVFQIGPANRNEGNLIRSATYNTYDNKDSSYLYANNFPNNTRISSGTALELYKLLHPDATGIPDGDGYFCVPFKHKLTVYAKVNNSGPGYSAGDSLNGGNPIYGPVEAKHGDSVDAKSSGYNPTGYTFANWGILNSDMSTYTNQSSNTVRDITWKSLTEDRNLDVYYWKDTFQGLSRVRDGGASGTVKKTTGYVQSSSHAGIYTINNCPTSGCTVTFQHYLKRLYGGGSTTYSIKRTTSSISGSPVGFVKNVSTETFRSGAEVKEREQSYTLYPGQVVCETLIFNADVDTTGVKTTVCASANATVEGGQSIGLKVKNNSVDKWKEYQTEVWAKPGDELYYQATYTPGEAQVSHTATPDKYSLNGGTTSPSGTSRNTAQLGNLSAIGWKNAFRLSISFKSAYNHNYTYDKGSTTTKTETVPVLGHKVGVNETGMSLDGLAKLNSVSGVKNTPAKVEFSTISETLSRKSSDTDSKKAYYTKANVVTETPESSAYARVPHNFDNTTVIDTCDKDVNASCSNSNHRVAYAGEPIPIKYHYYVNPKSNSLTTNSPTVKYATTVYNPKWKLTLCVTGGECYSTSERTQSEFNVPLARMYQTLDNNWEENLNVPDVPAGTEVCVYSSIFPATSGPDNNYTNPDGDGSWRNSARSCFTVAKRPSLQVWGGNVYSNGVISTSDANKRSLAGYSGNKAYAVEGGSQRFVFGSWGELGVLSNGTVSGFASGASLGYGGINNSGVLSPNPYASPSTGNTASSASNPGGATKTGLCNHAPLSFANNPCDGTTGLLGSTIVSSSMNGDKNDILTKFAYGGTPNVSGTVTLNDSTKFRDDNYYYYGSNDLTIPASTVERGTIQVVHSGRNIAINGNVTYDDTYISLSDVPKLVVYAEGNINIACGVNRVDAILIAVGDVNTCADAPANINAKARSQGQLKINGAVIAGHLLANRTYGAATGANSIIPAEIIDFDPTLYRWGEVTASSSMEEETSDTSINLDTAYQAELAPRL